MRVIFALLLSACSDYKFVTPRQSHGGDDTAPPETVADTGEPIEIQEDVWDLSATVGVDVLFFGDTSGSMSAELTTLGGQVTTFVERLATYTDHWQLLAVTGPSGCGVNGILTPETADYAALFAAGITTPPGEDDVDEWGLHNSMQAVAQSAAGGCNEGFLRDNARLHVIFISDEDDNSPGWDSKDSAYWTPYTDAIVAAKGAADQVVFSGVIGPVPDGCADAEPGWGYADAISAYGGELLSICDAWEKRIDLLVDASVAWPSFPLSATPIPETLTVTVNGVSRPDGWIYEASDNTVFFSAEIPTIGDKVVIAYVRAS